MPSPEELAHWFGYGFGATFAASTPKHKRGALGRLSDTVEVMEEHGQEEAASLLAEQIKDLAVVMARSTKTKRTPPKTREEAHAAEQKGFQGTPR